MLQAAKIIGTGMTTTGLIGAGMSAVIVSFNGVNTLVQKKIESDKNNGSNKDNDVKGEGGSDGPFSSAFSIGEGRSDLDYVYEILYSNYILHVAMLYLLISLVIIIITKNIINNSKKVKILEKYFSEKIYNIIIKYFSKIENCNKYILRFILLILIIACV